MSVDAWTSALTVPVDQERDHIRGPLDAPVTLLEYGDYECNSCGAAHPIVMALETHFERGLRFVYRHFPITSAHPLAQKAAEAAEAAGAQGDFWGMHDLLFENQLKLSEDKLLALAQKLNLDLGALANDLRQHRHLVRIREDQSGGARSGVTATPAFFINGLRHDGPWNFDGLFSAITHAAMEKKV